MLLAYHAGLLSIALRTPQPRSSAVRCVASWPQLDAATTREASVKAFEALKEDGSARLWGQLKLAPRAVSLRELCQTTKLPEKALDPTASEFSTKEIQDRRIRQSRCRLHLPRHIMGGRKRRPGSRRRIAIHRHISAGWDSNSSSCDWVHFAITALPPY